VSATLNTPATSYVSWTNPCSEVATVAVAFISEGPSGSFGLLLKGQVVEAADNDGKQLQGKKRSAFWKKAFSKVGQTRSQRSGYEGFEGADGPGDGSDGQPLKADLTGRFASMASTSSQSSQGEGASAFEVVEVSVPAHGVLQIPFSFCPPLLREYQAQVAVALVTPAIPATVPVVWRYVLKGLSQADTKGVTYKLKCRARQTVEVRARVQVMTLHSAGRSDSILSCDSSTPSLSWASKPNLLCTAPQ
jgi:hypothetical protein